jgi:hypothetical protein
MKNPSLNILLTIFFQNSMTYPFNRVGESFSLICPACEPSGLAEAQATVFYPTTRGPASVETGLGKLHAQYTTSQYLKR